MTGPTHPIVNAFNWRTDPRPSVFAQDPVFAGNKRTGKTQSQVATESVAMVTKRDGRSPGSIRGLSSRGNLLIEESENARKDRNV